MPKLIEVYEHHGEPMHVWSEAKGQHRERCLCYQCALFNQDQPGSPREDNCPIANELYDLCVRRSIVAPVAECAEFVPRTNVDVFYDAILPYWAQGDEDGERG